MYSPETCRQTLLIDADDMLWENNIYFERAIARFIEHVAHAELTADQIWRRLDEEERRARGPHGYGARALAVALQRTWRTFTSDDHLGPSPGDIEEFALAILELEIELLPNITATLERLAARHDLALVTMPEWRRKGEQLLRWSTHVIGALLSYWPTPATSR